MMGNKNYLTLKNVKKESYRFYPEKMKQYGDYLVVHDSMGWDRHGYFSVTHIPSGGALNVWLTYRQACILAKLVQDNISEDTLKVKAWTKAGKIMMDEMLTKDKKIYMKFKRLIWTNRPSELEVSE